MTPTTFSHTDKVRLTTAIGGTPVEFDFSNGPITVQDDDQFTAEQKAQALLGLADAGVVEGSLPTESRSRGRATAAAETTAQEG